MIPIIFGGFQSFEVKDMVGKTFAKVEQTHQGHDQDAVLFVDRAGDHYLFHHIQDCCEGVNIHEIVGDLDDLVGSPLLAAEVVSNSAVGNDEYGTQTWTFYKFSTINGSVTMSWHGTSNGYYSESVDQTFVKGGRYDCGGSNLD